MDKKVDINTEIIQDLHSARVFRHQVQYLFRNNKFNALIFQMMGPEFSLQMKIL
jgi:hypothetical protein